MAHIFEGKSQRITWKPNKASQYAGIIVERFNGEDWRPIAEYGAQYDPGFHNMVPGEVYRLKSLWYTSRDADGNYTGNRTEVLESGVFRANTIVPPGNEQLTVRDGQTSHGFMDSEALGDVVNFSTFGAKTTLRLDDINIEVLAGGTVAQSNTQNFFTVRGTTYPLTDNNSGFESLSGSLAIRGGLSITRVEGISYTNIGVND